MNRNRKRASVLGDPWEKVKGHYPLWPRGSLNFSQESWGHRGWRRTPGREREAPKRGRVRGSLGLTPLAQRAARHGHTPAGPGTGEPGKRHLPGCRAPLKPRGSHFDASRCPINNPNCYSTRTKGRSPPWRCRTPSHAVPSLGWALVGAPCFPLPWPPCPSGLPAPRDAGT